MGVGKRKDRTNGDRCSVPESIDVGLGELWDDGREAWRAAFHEVTKSWTGLRD